MAEMKKRRTNLMQKTIAVLLSAVLIAGAVWNDALPDVRAQERSAETVQESAGADVQETQQAQTAEEEIPAETAQHTQTPSTQEEPAAEPTQDADREQPQTQEEPAAQPTQDAAQEQPQGAEGEQSPTQSAEAQQPTTEQPNDSGSTEEALTEGTTDTAAEQTAQEVQNTTGSGNLAEGSGWAIDAEGVLTIESDDGFADWVNNGMASHYREVTKAVIKSGVQKIPDSAFGSSDSVNCWNMVSVEIPDTVTEIGSAAFYYCNSLEAITLPDTVKSLGSAAFHSCSNLTSCRLSENITSIPNRCFEHCDKLTAITIPAKVTSIGYYAFWSTGLTSVTIPANVTSIGVGAFLRSRALETVYMLPTEPPTLGNNAFGTKEESNSACLFVKNGTQGIRVPEGSVDTYKGKEGWSAYADNITAGEPPAASKGWTLDTDGVLTIESDEGFADWVSNGMASHCEKVTKAVINSGVKKIPSRSFGNFFKGSICAQMVSVEIPDTVTEIGGAAFEECGKLQSIEIPDTVTSLGKEAFSGCRNLTTCKLSKNITSITDDCFYSCENLTAITIPDKVTEIANKAFRGTGLTSVTIPAKVTSIGSNAFLYSKALETVYMLPAEPPTLGNNAFGTKEESNSACLFVKNGTQGIRVPEGSVDTYKGKEGWSAYADNITAGEPPAASKGWTLDADGVLTIESDDGFADWVSNGLTSHYNKVKKAVIKSGVQKIPDSAFGSSDSVNCWNMVSVEIPDTVTEIGSAAFYYCNSLEAITLPDTVKSLGSAAFHSCSNLTSCRLSENITSIPNRCFEHCDKLTAITIPAKVTSIGYYAFWSTGLTSVTIPANVTSIGVGAFLRSRALETVYMLPTEPPTLGNNAFGTKEESNSACLFVKNGTQGIRVPEGSVDTYKGKEGWSAYADNITAGEPPAASKGWTLDADGVLTIESDDGFADWRANGFPDRNTRDAVKSVVINEDVTEIPDNAFLGDNERCTNLTSVQIPETVERIGMRAFAGTGLTSIEIPDSVTEIGQQAFATCNALAACKLPNSLTSVPQELFQQCSALTGITIPDSVTKIETGAFSGCTALTDVVLSQNLTEIERNAFFNCSALTAVTIPDKVGKIGGHAFYHCSKLAAVVMKGSQPPQLHIETWNEIRECPFDGCAFVDKEQSVKVPADAVDTYKNHTDWEVYRDCIAADIPPVQHTHRDNDGREIVFTAWDSENSLPGTAGNYYLTKDVTLTDTWNVPSGETNLCLNGKTISASGTENYRVITISESGTLNLYDCQNAGNITGGKGGGVRNDGTFCMYGGRISGNSCEDTSGGGVNNQGVFQMYGGEISGNSAVGYGGVGGGVYIGKGTFAMYGGKISGNTSNTGGGVGSLSIAGTPFIYNEPLTIGGDAVISGNTCNEKENNVCLNDGQTITIESSNPLSGFAKVGITTETAPTDASPVNITGTNGADYSSFFTSDNAAYTVENGTDNTVLLTLKQTHSHIWAKTWSSDTTHHWHACTVDGCSITENADKDGYAAHTEDSGTVTTPPTQETAGVRTYKCSVCGYVMRTEEVEKLPPTHEHTYGTDWKTDADSHWHECMDCGDKKDLAAHTPDDGTVTKEPTKEETGIKTYKCKVCGYTMRTETLPATGGGGDKPGGGDDKPGGGDDNPGADKGEISQEIQKDENAPDTKIPIPEKELGDLVLTPEDKEEAEKGSDIKILLTVTDAQNSVSDDDKKAVNGALNGYKVGQYLDISLFKVIGANQDKVTETAGKVRIVITIPDALKNTNTKKTRTFGVIRVHNGQAVFLNDMDSDENTITIETDRFSTYAIVYKDTNKKGSGGGGGSHKNDSTDSSSNSAGTAPAAPSNTANTAAAADLNTANALNTVDALNAANALNAADALNTAADQTAAANANRNGQGKDNEPKTGDRTPIELYATLAMISALSYFALYFKERKRGITEAEKRAFTGKLVQWARQGGRLRKWIAIMIAFVYLAYYHSIGKQVAFAWEEVM